MNFDSRVRGCRLSADERLRLMAGAGQAQGLSFFGISPA